MKFLVCLTLFIFIQSLHSFSLHYNLDGKENTEQIQQTSDTYMSPFRREREKAIGLAIKSGNDTLKNELNKVQYQNYKVKKLGAKVALEQAKTKKDQLRPLSMRTMSLKDNPIFGQNPNSMAFIKSLSSRGQPPSFLNIGGQFMNSFGRNRPISSKNSNNTLREQRLKLLEDESFLKKNSKLSHFLYSQNRDQILKNQIDQMTKENELRRSKIKPNFNDFYGKATKANTFKFEKSKNENIDKDTKNKNNHNDKNNNNNDSEYYEDSDYDEREQTLSVVNKLPKFKDTKNSNLNAPEVFKQSEESKTKEIQSIELSAKIQKPAEFNSNDENVDELNSGDENTQDFNSKLEEPEELIAEIEEDEDEFEENEQGPIVRKLSVKNDENAFDWDEMDREEEQYKQTLELQDRLRSILGLRYDF